MTIDYLVNIDCMCIERASVGVPSVYLSCTVDNVTYIIHDDDMVLAPGSRPVAAVFGITIDRRGLMCRRS